MEEIKRYSAGLNGTAFIGMVNASRGEYVLYSDHQTALAVKNAEISRLTDENKELRSLLTDLRAFFERQREEPQDVRADQG